MKYTIVPLCSINCEIFDYVKIIVRSDDMYLLYSSKDDIVN